MVAVSAAERQQLEDGYELAEHDMIQLARTNMRAFFSYVMRDEETGAHVEMEPFQEEWHDLLDKYERLIIWSFAESGKALALDTQIPTPAGWTTMGELRVGQSVFDARGLPCQVTAATNVQRDRKVYRVRFDDGGELLADEDHLWIATRHQCATGGPILPLRTVSTKEMLAAGITFKVNNIKKDGTRYHRYRWRIPLSDPVQYPEQDLPIHPYVFGAWLGDGTSAGTRITCAFEDRFIFDRCMALEGGDCKLLPCKARPNVGTGTLGGFSDQRRPQDKNSLRQRLFRSGAVPPDRKKGSKHIPELYLRSSESQRRELLAGLLDTDGSADGAGKGRVEFSSMTERLAKDVLELARSLGFKATIRSKIARINGRACGTAYRVCFSARVPVFKLPRKLGRQIFRKPTVKMACRLIVAIEPVESVPVRCIAVDSLDHSYLAGRDYTVTHNSASVSVSRTLWELGRDPSLRFAIVSKSEDRAIKIASQIGQYILASPELHKVFPNLVPDPRYPWNSEQLTVRRPVLSKDPSVNTLGWGSNTQGARVDRLILDDVVTHDNTHSDYVRKEMLTRYLKTFPSRMTARGRILGIGNALHPDDLFHTLAKNPRFKAFKYPIIKRNGQSIWPSKWPLSRIEARKIELGPLETMIQLMCQAIDDAMARFKREWLDTCKARGEGKDMVYALRFVPPLCKVYCGVDLGIGKNKHNAETVFFIGLVHPNGDREVLWIEGGRWRTSEIMARARNFHERFHCIFVVENVAAQDLFVQILQGSNEMNLVVGEESQVFLQGGSTALPIIPFTTGRNKADPTFGVEALSTKFAAGKYIIPSRGGACHPEIAKWIDGLLGYSPLAHTADRVMAGWFFDEGERMNVPPPPPPPTGVMPLRLGKW